MNIIAIIVGIVDAVFALLCLGLHTGHIAPESFDPEDHPILSGLSVFFAFHAVLLFAGATT